MQALQVSVSATDLAGRMQFRLNGGGSAVQVVWQRRGQRVLVHLDSLQIRILDGWCLCSVDLEADATKRQTIQLVFFLGTSGEGDGLRASGTINAPSAPAAQLADIWGADLLRLIWDAVLDGIEAALALVRQQQPAVAVTLEGFTCGTDALLVHLLAGVP